MPVEITVYDVPERVRDRLAGKAADRSQSLEEYLRAELEQLAERFSAKPSVGSWLAETRRRVEAAGTRVSAAEILDARDADRR